MEKPRIRGRSLECNGKANEFEETTSNSREKHRVRWTSVEFDGNTVEFEEKVTNSTEKRRTRRKNARHRRSREDRESRRELRKDLQHAGARLRSDVGEGASGGFGRRVDGTRSAAGGERLYLPSRAQNGKLAK